MNTFTHREQQAFEQIFGNVSDFADGQRDCRDGFPPKANANEDYLRGYGVQYETEARQEKAI